MACENGGGAFIVVCPLAFLLMAAPLMLAEFVVGSSSRGDIATAFVAERPAGDRRFIGALMLLVSFAVLSRHAVVAGAVRA